MDLKPPTLDVGLKECDKVGLLDESTVLKYEWEVERSLSGDLADIRCRSSKLVDMVL